jgi:hypothetical protein
VVGWHIPEGAEGIEDSKQKKEIHKALCKISGFQYDVAEDPSLPVC